VVGGASVARFMPDGTLLSLTELPVTWPTSCTFGGPDLATLYVTSARFTMTAQHLAANPDEGSLIAVDGAGTGIPEPKFAG
jgi:sugar lactone lactonase YvrE